MNKKTIYTLKILPLSYTYNLESKINKQKRTEYRNFSVILFQDCVVKYEFETRNLARRTDPHPVKPQAKAGLGPTTSEWSTRMLKTHLARFSTASVDPPSKFPSFNLPLIKCTSLTHYIYLRSLFLKYRFDKCGNHNL